MDIQSLVDSWSNNACLGYVIIACKNLGYTTEQAEELILAIENAFSNFTVEEAKQVVEH